MPVVAACAIFVVLGVVAVVAIVFAFEIVVVHVGY
jgi:hypothetical protein